MNAVDLFAGLGGWTAGATAAGLRVLFAANHWRAAVDAHAANHPDVHHECQDLMQVDWRILPDLRDGALIASPACQGFSSNGLVLHRCARIHAARPSDRNTTWGVLAAADTARPAIILVENVPELARWDLFPAWCDTLRARPGIAARMRDAQGRAGRACLWANVDKARGRSLDELAPTMTTRSAGQWYLLDGDQCRVLTVLELKRIQGFPDSYRVPKGRTLAGKLLGNAVPPPMARAIVEQVMGRLAA